jgi:hypothetical protein
VVSPQNQGPSEPNTKYLDLTLSNFMSLNSWDLSPVPDNVTVAEFIFAVVQDPDLSNSFLSEGLPRNADHFVAYLKLNEDEAVELYADDTLREANIHSGDHLIIGSVPRGNGGGPPWIAIAHFVESAAASGIIGSIAYDLLKSRVTSIANHWRQRKDRSVPGSLDEVEALSIARNCACLRLNIDPKSLVMISSYCHPQGSKHPEEWFFRFNVIGSSEYQKTRVRVRLSSAEIENAVVLIES